MEWDVAIGCPVGKRLFAPTATVAFPELRLVRPDLGELAASQALCLPTIGLTT